MIRAIGVLVVLCLCLQMHSVLCLKCHICSTMNPGEADCEKIAESNSKYLHECDDAKHVSCRIQEQWVDFELLKQTTGKRTIRQCASTPYDASRQCYYRAGFGGKVNVCNCEGDGCNGASGLASVTSIIIATLGSLLLMKHLY